MTELADRYLGQFRGRLRENIALRGLGGLAVGVLTGRTTSTVFQAINLAQLMIAGESRLGTKSRNSYRVNCGWSMTQKFLAMWTS